MSEIHKMIHDPKLRISRNQKIRWCKKRIIPQQILEKIYTGGKDGGRGLKFVNKLPSTGMKLDRFLELLRKLRNRTKNSEERASAIDLYVKIIEAEMMSRNDWAWKRKPSKPKLHHSKPKIRNGRPRIINNN